MSIQVETLEGIAQYLGISVAQVCRLARPETKGSLSKVLLEKTRMQVCRDGKVRRFVIKYSLDNLLDEWQILRRDLRVWRHDSEPG